MEKATKTGTQIQKEANKSKVQHN